MCTTAPRANSGIIALNLASSWRMSTSMRTASASFNASAVVSQMRSSFAKPVFFETRCFASPSTVKPPAWRSAGSWSFCSGNTAKRTEWPDSVKSEAHTAPMARAVLPMTATFVMTVRSGFRLDAGVLDHLGPLLGLGFQENGEFLRRAADRLGAVEAEALGDLRQLHDARDLGSELLHDGLRHAGGRDHALERFRPVAGNRLAHGGHVGHAGLALGAGEGERAQLPGLDVRRRGDRRGEEHRHPAAEHVGHGRRDALVGYVDHLDAGGVLEHL